MQPGVEGLTGKELIGGIVVVATAAIGGEKGRQRQQRPPDGRAGSENDDQVQPHCTAERPGETMPTELTEALHTLPAIGLS